MYTRVVYLYIYTEQARFSTQHRRTLCCVWKLLQRIVACRRWSRCSAIVGLDRSTSRLDACGDSRIVHLSKCWNRGTRSVGNDWWVVARWFRESYQHVIRVYNVIIIDIINYRQLYSHPETQIHECIFITYKYYTDTARVYLLVVCVLVIILAFTSLNTNIISA